MLRLHTKEHYVRLCVVVGLAVSLFAGCKKPEADIWSCNNPRRGACSQWSIADSDDETRASHKTSCERMGGSVSEGPCPHEDVVGSCVAGGGAASRIVYYAPRPVTEARRACASLGGTWK
jgi:hypothetical protein